MCYVRCASRGREVIELPSTIGTLTLELRSDTNTLVTSIDIGNTYNPTLRFQPSPVLTGDIDQGNHFCWVLYIYKRFHLHGKHSVYIELNTP